MLGVTNDVLGKVKKIEFKDLVARSDLIVTVKVTKIEPGPNTLHKIDPGMPPLKIATAEVLETWKGKPLREVRFVASPTWMCDTSHAEVGERLVVFLGKETDSHIWWITHAGRGRMLQRVVKDRTYATVQSDVILPKETPKFSEEKTGKYLLGPSEPGKPPAEFTYTHTVISIELGVLQDMVKSASRKQ
jgi:hypothetical protein